MEEFKEKVLAKVKSKSNEDLVSSFYSASCYDAKEYSEQNQIVLDAVWQELLNRLNK